MEMPELNEDILEGESSQEMIGQEEGQPMEEQSAGPADDSALEIGEEKDSTLHEGTEESQPETDENTLDDSELSKQDESMEPVAGLTAEDQDGDEEPTAKKLKLVESAEEAKQDTEDETEEKPDEDTKVDTNTPDTDMLSTLASAALEQDPKDEKESVVSTTSIKPEPEAPRRKVEPWCNVGVFDTNTTIVTDYVASPELCDDVDLVTATLSGKRIQLEPGVAYKFRVCAVNGCGTGPWSEVAAFKTTLPGFPGAPSAIKISKSPDGAHLTWEPPGGNSGEILEYAVYLAVRSASQGSQPVTTNQAQLAFVRVFCGPTNKCVVGPNSLQAAHIDTTTKPAIIFRIAAKNAKGYGPATQVRWLQDTTTSQNGTAQGVKRVVKG